jgi:hypothetical protein
MTYNVGLFAHTIAHRFKTTQIPPAATAAPAAIIMPIIQPLVSA